MKQKYQLFNRDISWLYFNERVLTEAAKENVPLMERIRFLAIYSSNLDEFYRVRMPAIRALKKIGKKNADKKKGKLQIRENVREVATQVEEIIGIQQEEFGKILMSILPLLHKHAVNLVYNQEIPEVIHRQVNDYFFTHALAFLQVVTLAKDTTFFPENNKLYLLVLFKKEEEIQQLIVNIPSEYLPRFFSETIDGVKYLVFLDDIIRQNLKKVLTDGTIEGIYSFKVTRDAELELADDYEGDLAIAIENQIEKRDLGLATRLLYQGNMPVAFLNDFTDALGLEKATLVKGGTYHNLRDFANLPVTDVTLDYEKWPAFNNIVHNDRLLSQIEQEDIMIHPPYQSYDTVVRFFNEAAINADVDQIFITIYRVATDSRIANALITAARNGKRVFVFVELKARFDEANNIKWAKKMKAAGIRIIYSIPALKVHAKIALIRKKSAAGTSYLGILATGNFNESTARFYTDHILLTAHKEILREVADLFVFLQRREKPQAPDLIRFKQLLVAQFNLQERFIDLIDREIFNSSQGLKAAITIKLNNLEEDRMIAKLYEASNAGVKICLLVRGICRLMPGVDGISRNITVTRIVDRYLEHGRIFIFHNDGNEELFLGSADWMYRNIHRRIEVVFPVYDEKIKSQLRALVKLQLEDNVQAVQITPSLHNFKLERSDKPLRSQQAIYELLKNTANEEVVPGYVPI